MSKWKKLGDSRFPYKTDWVTIREDDVIRPDDGEGIYTVLQADPFVLIIAIDQDEKIYFINQFRYPSQRESLEVPGGGSDGEDLLVAAKRELGEETGLTADRWERIGSFNPMNGMTDAEMHVFIARDLHEDKSLLKLEEEGITEIKKLSFQEALKLIQDGTIYCGETMASLLMALNHLGRL